MIRVNDWSGDLNISTGDAVLTFIVAARNSQVMLPQKGPGTFAELLQAFGDTVAADYPCTERGRGEIWDIAENRIN